MDQDFIDAISIAAERTPGPLVVPWPARGNPGAFRSFESFPAWRDFILKLGLRETLPLTVTGKYQRAQKLFLLAWIDADLIKVGELLALTTLELALKDRYGQHLKKPVRLKKGADPLTAKNNAYEIKFAHLLRYMVEKDGLTDAQLPMIQRYGGSVVPLLLGDRKPSLAEIRNTSAHGDPFEGFPWSGLLELVRDLVHYAYRNWP